MLIECYKITISNFSSIYACAMLIM